MTFAELGLNPELLKAVTDLGFENPTDIQEKSIPHLIADDIDFIGQAQTGTGKTAAFSLPLLNKLNSEVGAPQALIIAPTRELANQIQQDIKTFSKYMKVRSLSVYGGTPISTQIRGLKKDRPEIVVGTPGRIMDLMNRGALKLDNCRYVILDEADEMLDMGFFDDIKEIVGRIENKKTWMFSATMPKEILKLVKEHFCDPLNVKVTKKILTNEMVQQLYCIVNRSNQSEALCRYLDFQDDIYGIVFCQTKIGAKEVTDGLNGRGFPADSLHGDMSQDQRDITMKNFKAKKIRLLVCTDVAARGIDVSDLTHVINYSFPQDNESYVHRIGRTGRAGSKGIALTIATPSESRRVSQIERITKAKIEKIKLPNVEELCNRLLERGQQEFLENATTFDIESERFDSFKKGLSKLTKEDLIKGIFSDIYEESLKKYKGARDLDVQGVSAAKRGTERFFLNLGSKDGLTTGDLIKFVSTTLNVSGSELGRINLKDTFSFFEMPGKYTDLVLSLKGESFGKRTVSVQVAKPPRGGGGRSGGPNRRSGGNRSSGGRAGGRSSNGRSSSGNRESGNSFNYNK